MTPIRMATAGSDEAPLETQQGQTIEELFEVLESPLLQYALRFVHERGVAEDLVQDAFMKLQANFDHVLEPRRWLFRTVHNQALNYQRQSGKIVPMEWTKEDGSTQGMDLADPQPGPDEQVLRWEGIGLVQASLSELDDRSRQLIHLKFNDGLTYQQISARTGLTTGHVGYLLHHALKTIAADLSRNGGLP